ncbi:sugar phosphate isomerase/epimerase [Novosphingobium flavum]|uniref:sugar phosphate isomerase/epimerase family protein n=1 Tax=Novosphingobium aerophilum TaxID=2839843 RepID=UPI00163A51DA|nr:TIM barrel protein [Novosphingobium aerophilum]MBC2663759.1 sugar phosphate isomerase/epimerase [Novosphingobium aerophilum]
MTGSFKYGVSTYSYVNDYGSIMTLEDAFDHIADTGATGIEILGEGQVEGYPEPGKEWLDLWFALLDRYQLEPTNMCSWVDMRITLNRNLTVEEGAAELARDLHLAHRLGFKFLRPKFGVLSHDLIPEANWEAYVERNLDLAAKYDIVMCPEIHAPTPIKHQVVDGYIDFIERTGTKHFGLMVDTGIFQNKPLTHWGSHQINEEARKHMEFLNGIAVNPEEFLDIAKYVVFIQAKFHDIDENLEDLHIPWKPVISALKRAGYSGWLSSEYEGLRAPWRAIDQVRRQHVLLRKLEREYDEGTFA